MLAIDPPALLARNFIFDAYGGAVHWIYNLDEQGWMLVLCGALVVGFYFLRGFGSRTNF
jgi:hypothetical protein